MPHRANHTIKSLVKSINFKYFFCKTIFFVISISLISKTVKKYSSFMYKEKWYPWIYVTGRFGPIFFPIVNIFSLYTLQNKNENCILFETYFWDFDHPLTFPGVMWGPTQKRQGKYIYRLILFLLRLELLILKSTVEVFKFDTLIKVFPAGYNHHYV